MAETLQQPDRRDYGELQDEIVQARSQLQPHSAALEYEYRRACGKSYGGNADIPEVKDDPENWRHTWLRSFLAEVGYLPQWIIEAGGLEWPPERANLIELAANAQARRLNLRALAERCAIDYGFRSARLVCGIRSRYGQLEPFAERLAFDEFLTDPGQHDRARAQWWAHRVSRPIDEVIAEAEAQPGLGWDVASLKQVAQGLSRDPKRAQEVPSGVTRHELVYWPMWFPTDQLDDEHGPDQGFHGVVRYVLDPTIGPPTRGVNVRKPEPWFGSPCGPYAFVAGFKIGELPVELAPLVASSSQGGFVNDIARAIRDAIETYKQLAVTQDNVTAASIRNAANGTVITLPQGRALSEMFGQLESGGMQPQHMAAFQWAFEQMQRSSGIHSRLGDVDSQATATAVQNAQLGYSSTMGLYVNGYNDLWRQVGAKFAYWYDVHPEVSTRIGPLPPELQEVYGAAMVETRGTPQGAKSHRELALAVDTMSGRPKNDITLKQELLATQGLIQWLVGLGPHAVAVDIDTIVRQHARAYGSQWALKLVDAQMFRTIAALQLGQQGQPQRPQSTSRPGAQLAFDPGMGVKTAPSGGPKPQQIEAPPPKSKAKVQKL